MCKGNVSSVAPFTQNYVYSLRFCVKGATPRHGAMSFFHVVLIEKQPWLAWKYK